MNQSLFIKEKDVSNVNFFHTNLDKAIQHEHDDYVQQQLTQKQAWITRARDHYLTAEKALLTLQTILQQAPDHLVLVTKQLALKGLTDTQKEQLLISQKRCQDDIEQLPFRITAGQEQLQELNRAITAAEESLLALMQSQHPRRHRALSSPDGVPL